MALLLKITLTPLLLLGITWIGRVFGARIAGTLTGIPMVAGPVILFLAIEQGPHFAARSATSTLAGEASLIVFCIVYTLAARRLPWWQCVLIGWCGFLAATAGLDQLELGTLGCLAVGVVAPLILRISLVDPPPGTVAPLPVRPLYDLAARMLCGAILVVLLTAIASGLGPRLSGLLTPFPVATAVLAGFSHRAHGAAFSVELLRGLSWGMYSFGSFFVVIALTIESTGTLAAFCWAITASLAVQGVLYLAFRRA